MGYRTVTERAISAWNSGRIRTAPGGAGTPAEGLTSKTPEFAKTPGVHVADAHSRTTHRQSENPSAGGR